MTGPLDGVRVIEIAGMGAGPYTAMLLGDLGADVIRIDRPGTRAARARDYALARNRRSIEIDLKTDRGIETLMSLVEQADVIFEGFRPGVAERLGFGPDACFARRPSIVYGRMTGWGQTGPMSNMAGHDLNYLSLTGALTLFQRDGSQPATPPGFVADLGGGGLMLALGLVSAVVSSRATGTGQVVDAAMVDGVASLTTLVHSMSAQGRWDLDRPGQNFCDGGAPYYDSYVTSDDKYIAVAPIEPQFYAVMVELLGLTLSELPDRDDPANWDKLKRFFADIFRTRTRAEWTELFDGTDACVTPVLSFKEAMQHPHNVARKTFVEGSGVMQPAPAPRFSHTPGAITQAPPIPGEHSRDILHAWGIDAATAEQLIDDGVVIQN